MQKNLMTSAGITIQTGIDMVWLSKTWEWLKKNWKYVVTFGIPVLLSFIAGLLRSNRSLEKKVELEQNLRDVDNEANDLETKLKEEALELRDESIVAQLLLVEINNSSVSTSIIEIFTISVSPNST